jgi:hypothetical protein
LDNPGSPEVDSGTFKTYHATMGVNGRATQQEFEMNPFILSGTPMNINPTTSGLFLTNSPRTRNIQPTEYYTLGFTNYYLDNDVQLSQPYYSEYKFYDENGQLLETRQYQNTYNNGGGPLTDCTRVYQSLFTIVPKTNTEYNTLYLGAGPKNFTEFPDNTAQYTVQLFGNFTGVTLPPPTQVITPTPTPTPVPCTQCKTYSLTNTSPLVAAVYTYRDCETRQLLSNFQAPLTSTQICVCSGTFVEETNVLSVEIGEPCGPKPCTTCETLSIFNNYTDLAVLLEFWDCTINGGQGGYRQLGLNPLTGIQVCGCANSFVNQFSGVEIIPQGSCEAPTPTPTPSGPCQFIAHQVNLCVGPTCVNGTCICSFGAVTTVYTNCNTPTPFAQGARVYSNSSLTQRFVGTISNGSVIYNVVQVIPFNYGLSFLNCVINGPC